MNGNPNNRNRYTVRNQNRARTTPETEYNTALGTEPRQNSGSVYNTVKNQITLSDESTKPEPKAEPEFSARVFFTEVELPIPESCILPIKDIGDVPVQREVVNVGTYIHSRPMDGIDPGTIIKALTFEGIFRKKFVVKVTNRFGQEVGNAVGVFYNSLYTIPPIHYLSSKDLHREGLNHANPGRGRKTSETSMPAGIRQINAGDPFVELTLVGLNRSSAETSGFTGYHLMAICISLLNESKPPFLPDGRGVRPLNGLTYPIYVSSVPKAVGFYKRNGFVEFPPIISDGKPIYGNHLMGSQTNLKFEVPLLLVA